MIFQATFAANNHVGAYLIDVDRPRLQDIQCKAALMLAIHLPRSSTSVARLTQQAFVDLNSMVGGAMNCSSFGIPMMESIGSHQPLGQKRGHGRQFPRNKNQEKFAYRRRSVPSVSDGAGMVNVSRAVNDHVAPCGFVN